MALNDNLRPIAYYIIKITMLKSAQKLLVGTLTGPSAMSFRTNGPQSLVTFFHSFFDSRREDFTRPSEHNQRRLGYRRPWKKVGSTYSLPWF